jgi:hypothetical protein
MNSLFEKKDLRGRKIRTIGFGLAVLLIGMSMASYSRKGTGSSRKTPTRISLAQASDKAAQAKVKESAAKLPLAFEPNQGQTGAPVQYVARAQGYTAFLTAGTAVLRVKGATEGVLRMTMRNAQPASQVTASDPQIGKSNYLIGNDRSKWLTNVPHYGKVTYTNVYPGVDVVYAGNETNVEYDFVVKPGADPNRIRVAYEGSSRFALNAQGDLELQTPAGRTVAHKPVVYQTIDGRRKPVHGSYVLTAKNEVGFEIGSYDSSQPLIIDPTVTVLTFFGGTGNDVAQAVAANATGVYFTGFTASVNTSPVGTSFPLTPPTCPGTGTNALPCVTGAPVAAAFPTQAGYSGGANSGGTTDAFVTKLTTDGTTLIYSTFLGGSNADIGLGIAADSTGAAYITGNTFSGNFPVTNGSTLVGGQSAFLTKLNPAGTSLTYSEYFAATSTTSGNAITVDASGDAYVGGWTTGTIVPVNPIIAAATVCTGNTSNCSSAFSGNAIQGPQDGLVVKFDPNGLVLFSSLIGGIGVTTSVNGIALDSSNAIYIAGTANGNSGGINAATRFPTTNSGFIGSGVPSNTMASAAIGSLGFATKITLSANASTVAWSDTFGAGTETGTGIAVDAAGRAYIAGSTTAGFTLTNPQLGATANASATGTQNIPASGGPIAGYVLALAPNGLTTSYITFLNAELGSTVTTLNSIALDDIGQAYVTGALTLVPGPVADIYVARLNPPGTLGTTPTPGLANFGGLITGGGGSEVDHGNGIAVLPAVAGLRTAYVVGLTNATATLATPIPGVGVLATNTPQNYLLWGSAAGTLNSSATGSVTPAKLPALGIAVGGAPSGGDAAFATLTFRDLAANSTNVAFTAAAAPAGTAGTNQTQTITFAGAAGAALPCAAVGVVPLSTSGTFFSNGNGGSVGVNAGSVTISTGVQNIPALGTPATGSFQVTCATGSAFIEPTTVAVTYGSTAAYTATAAYTPVGGTAVTGAGSIALTASVGSVAGLPTTATLTVNVTGGTNVATSAISVAPANWVAGPGCANPITVASGSPVNITAGTAATVGLTVNTACIALAAPGTYSGGITIASTATPPLVSSISVPYTLTIGGGITATPLASLAFANNSASAQAQTSTLTASTGGPFSYTVSYAATNTSGLAALPAANVTLLAGASGSLNTGSTALLVLQVSPALLANGSYGGTLTINPSGTPTFTPYTIAVTALVGNGFLVTQPATSPLNISLPTGAAAGTTIPVTQLTGSQIVVTNLSPGSITITTASGVTSSFTGLATSPLTMVSTSGLSCTAAAGATCTYNVTANTTGVAAATYPGTITFTTSTPGGGSALSTSLAVNLTVTALPTFILTTSTASNTLLTAVNLTATANANQVCTGVAGQPSSPGISDTASSVANVTYTTSVSSGVNAFSVNPTGPTPVTTTSQAITVCANPQALGSTSGIFQGTVTVASSSAPGSTVSFPVNLLLNSTPGNIDLSNIGVFRNTGGLGTFLLDLNQSAYTYAGSTTLTEFYGLNGDQPVAGDWLGTGVVSIGVFRQGAWYFDLNNDGAFEANEGPFYFGLPGDTAIVGDWTGSGSTKVGVFRCPAVGAPGVCTWYLSNAVQTAATLVPGANLYTPASTLVYNYGLPGDQPVANNWTGAARADNIGVFRCPAVGAGVCSWIVNSVGDGSTATLLNLLGFGLPGDIAVVGDWNDNNQRKRIGVFRGGTWILDVNGTNVFAPNDIQTGFGLPGDKPVVGKWTQ